MTLVSYLFLLFSVSYATADLQCGVGEVIDNCPADCSSDNCPKNETYIKSCVKPVICPPAACKCQFNYRRADNKTCIPTTSCPPFDCSARPNEEFNSCPSYCPTDNCNQATTDGRCPVFGHILIVVQCSPACRCIKNYWRRNGLCVPYDKCFT